MRHKRFLKRLIFIPITIIGIIAIVIIGHFILNKNKIKVINASSMTELTLNKKDFKSGVLNENLKEIKDTNYIYIKKLYEIGEQSFRLSSDNSIRLQIKEYTKDKDYIGTIDMGDHDLYTKSDECYYITFTAYKDMNGQVESTNYKELISDINSLITLTSIDTDSLDNLPATNSTYINKGSLSNKANYKTGRYLSWGGSYSNEKGSYCTRDFYMVDPQTTYFININDSRVSLTVNEYDKDGKWLYYKDSLTNGKEYKPTDNKVAYIGITIRSIEWSIDPMDLLKANLIIDFGRDFYIDNLEKEDIENVDFSNIDNYSSGLFYKGNIGVDKNCLRLNYYLNVKQTKYMVECTDHYLKMYIQEFDNNNSLINSCSKENGESFSPKENTSYIAIYLKCENDVNFSYYKNDFNIKKAINLSQFIPYNYNKEMADLSAKDIVNSINVGWNLGNSLDSHYGDPFTGPHLNQETTWGNITVSKDLIDYVKQQGFNTIRIPVTWVNNTYRDDNGHLKVYTEWLERVSEVVCYAYANNMYVIINTHHEQPIIYAGTTDDKFNQVCSDARDLWKEIATYFKDYDEKLIFESYNEVDNVEKSWNFSKKAASQVNTLNQIFVDTVRETGANNAKRVLMIPTLLDGSEKSYLDAFVMPKDSVSGKIILTVHNYSTLLTTDINTTFATLKDYADKLNVPIVIGEFGSSKKTFLPLELRNVHASNYVKCAANYGIKCIYWDNGAVNDYAIVNRKDFSLSETDIITALINPSSYSFKDSQNLNSFDNFLYMTLNQGNGELKEDKYWGSITTGSMEKGIEISDGVNYISLNLYAVDEFENLKIHYVHFYDSDMNLIENNNDGYGYKNKTFKVPDNAKYLRIGINNSSKATKQNEYANGLDSGKISLSLGFINTNDKKTINKYK